MKLDSATKKTILTELNEYLIPRESVPSVAARFKCELHERLHRSDNSMLSSNLKESNLNKGSCETGVKLSNDIVLAIDFGGTNLKFAIFKTKPLYSIQFMKSIIIESKIVDLEFFDNIVQEILNHLNDYLLSLVSENTQNNNNNNGTEKFQIPISITFSFPLNSNNEIKVMGKNYTMTDEIRDRPIDKILQASFDKNIKRQHYSLSKYLQFIISDNIINDSIAVHLTNKFILQKSNDSKMKNMGPSSSSNDISLILGTGLNSCFELPTTILPDFKRTNDSNRTIINSELGFLGHDIINLSPYDVCSKLKMPMPLENITSGNYLPVILKNILNYYSIYPELTINFDGEMFVNLIEGNDLKIILQDIELDFVREIAMIIMQRASFYIVSAILAIDMLINENSTNTRTNDHCDDEKFSNKIKIGYVGSFLAYSKYYQEQINYYSNSCIDLQYLQDSSLFGAAVAANI